MTTKFKWKREDYSFAEYIEELNLMIQQNRQTINQLNAKNEAIEQCIIFMRKIIEEVKND